MRCTDRDVDEVFLTITMAVTEVRRTCVRACMKAVIGSDCDRSARATTSTCHTNEKEKTAGEVKQIYRNSDDAQM